MESYRNRNRSGLVPLSFITLLACGGPGESAAWIASAQAAEVPVQTAQEGRQFVETVLTKAYGILSGGNGDKKVEFSKMLQSYFDMEHIATSILREYKTMPPEQKAAFIAYLKRDLLNIYATDAKVKTFMSVSCFITGVSPLQAMGADTQPRITVKTLFYPKAAAGGAIILQTKPAGSSDPGMKPTFVGWSLVKKGGAWLITDVKIDAFSQLRTLRDTYTAKYRTDKAFYLKG